jgi:hypothetical protein
MRLLVIGPEEKTLIARVAEHAKAHPYRPGPGVLPPGDDDRFVVTLGTYRAVFSITHGRNGVVARQLSVSVPGTKYPNPAAVFMIAHEFGFTGWDETKPAEPGKDWIAGPHLRDRCAVVAQEIKAEGENHGA